MFCAYTIGVRGIERLKISCWAFIVNIKKKQMFCWYTQWFVLIICYYTMRLHRDYQSYYNCHNVPYVGSCHFLWDAIKWVGSALGLHVNESRWNWRWCAKDTHENTSCTDDMRILCPWGPRVLRLKIYEYISYTYIRSAKNLSDRKHIVKFLTFSFF